MSFPVSPMSSLIVRQDNYTCDIQSRFFRLAKIVTAFLTLAKFAISYGLCMLSTAFYACGYAFEIVSSTLEQIRFWLRIEYIGIPFGTVFWFIMVLQYTGRQALVRRWIVTLLLAVPTLTFVAHNTNEWHHLQGVSFRTRI